ncbi:hypothetical protein Tco_0024802 [Tanacetum coccineum]
MKAQVVCTPSEAVRKDGKRHLEFYTARNILNMFMQIGILNSASAVEASGKMGNFSMDSIQPSNGVVPQSPMHTTSIANLKQTPLVHQVFVFCGCCYGIYVAVIDLEEGMCLVLVSHNGHDANYIRPEANTLQQDNRGSGIPFIDVQEIPGDDYPEHYFNFASYNELPARPDVKHTILTGSEANGEGSVQKSLENLISDMRLELPGNQTSVEVNRSDVRANKRQTEARVATYLITTF